MIRSFLYRSLLKLAHRYDWHHASIHELPDGGFEYRCECGLHDEPFYLTLSPIDVSKHSIGCELRKIAMSCATKNPNTKLAYTCTCRHG